MWWVLEKTVRDVKGWGRVEERDQPTQIRWVGRRNRDKGIVRFKVIVQYKEKA